MFEYWNLYLQVLKTLSEHRLGVQAIEMEHALPLQNVQTKADSLQDRVLEGTYYVTSTVLDIEEQFCSLCIANTECLYINLVFIFRFGVCCVFMVTACGSTISQNCSYIKNPGKFQSSFLFLR